MPLATTPKKAPITPSGRPRCTKGYHLKECQEVVQISKDELRAFATGQKVLGQPAVPHAMHRDIPKAASMATQDDDSSTEDSSETDRDRDLHDAMFLS